MLVLIIIIGLIIYLSNSGKKPDEKTVDDNSQIYYYRTKDGKDDYRFQFRNTKTGWKAFILQQPSYKTYASRSEDLHSTHRLTEGNKYYVCWDTPLKSLDDCKKVASLWADCTQYYRKNGGDFKDIARKI